MESRIPKVATIFTLTFLLLIGIFSTPVSAAVVWSDDFNDGNYDGWTILEGTFDTTISPKYSLTCGSVGINMIYHSSTQLVGTWLFELYEDIENITDVLFIATGTIIEDFEGYSLYLHPESSGYRLTFSRWNYSSIFEQSARHLLISYDIWTTGTDVPSPDWHSYNITRTDDGDVYISRDSELVIHSRRIIHEIEFAEVITNCDKFLFRGEEDTAIDTISVGTDLPPIQTETSNTTTTITTTTTNTTGTLGNLGPYLPLIAIGGSAIFIIVVIILIMKKR